MRTTNRVPKPKNLISVRSSDHETTKGETHMAEEDFRVKNEAGMWIRTEPVVSETTKKVLLPKGHLVTKLANTNNPDWWLVRASFQGADVEGFSNKNLLLAAAGPAPSPVTGSIGELITKTLTVLTHVAPKAH